MEIIIEEISRGHKLIGRHKFVKGAVSIGRGYQNDIIVADPHVCSEHLQLRFNGENWVAFDQDSINGSFIEKNKQVAHQHIISSGDVITIGKSQVRVVFPDHPIEESITFSPFEQLINFTRHPAALAFSICFFAIMTGWVFYLSNAKEVTFTQLLVPTVGMTLLVAIWPLLVSLISHLTKNDARTMAQLGICFAFFNLMWVSDVIESIVEFNVSSNGPLIGLVSLLPIAMVYGLFWFNCHVGFHMSTRKRIIVAASLTTLLLGSGFLIELSKKPEFSAHPQYNSTLMTPAFMFAASSSVDEFINDSNQLFTDAQLAAKEDEK